MAARPSNHRRVLLIGGTVAAVLLVGKWTVPVGPAAPTAERYADDGLEELLPYLAASEPVPAIDGMEVGAGFESDPFAAGEVEPLAGDPVVRPTLGSSSRPWQLSAILVSDDRSIAIIDDRVRAVGDTVRGGARVREIEREHVVLVTQDGQRRTIPLK